MGFFDPNLLQRQKQRPQQLIKINKLIDVDVNGDITAKQDFSLGNIEINNLEKGGKVHNADVNFGNEANGNKISPFAWVKSGAELDLNGGIAAEKDFLWCNFAERLDDKYEDDKGSTHYYLKEDNISILWLLDDIDAFQCKFLQKYTSLGDIHHKCLESVAVVPEYHTKPVVIYDNGIASTVQVHMLGSYNSKEKRVELYIDEIKVAAKKFSEKKYNYDKVFLALFASTYVHEMMHAYFDRDQKNPNGYIQRIEEPLAEAASILFLSAFAEQQEDNKVKVCLDLVKQFVENKKGAQTTMHYGLGTDLAETLCYDVFNYKSGMGYEVKDDVEKCFMVRSYSKIDMTSLQKLFKDIININIIS